MPGHKVARSAVKDTNAFDKYQCSHCRLLLKNAVQPVCGHLLCESCAVSLLASVTPKCPRPDCQEDLKSDLEDDTADLDIDYFPDRFVRREIEGLIVYCSYKEKGCSWEDKLPNLETHLKTCQYALEECQQCGEVLTPEKNNSHKLACPKAVVKCPLAELGCSHTETMTSSDLEEHVTSHGVEHTTIIAEVLKNFKTGKSAASLQNITNHGTVPHSPGAASLNASKLKMPKEESTSESFPRNVYVPNFSRQFGQLTDDDLGYGSQSPTLMHSEPFLGVASKLKTEIETGLRSELRRNNEEIGILRNTVTKLEKSMRSKHAEAEDRDFRLSLIENSNYDGSMVWKIPQFSQRMSDAQTGKYTSIFSLPFYTGRHGYKMCLCLYILGDGIGKNTHMSLFFVIMRGEFDSILQWPFTHKVTFKLINQTGARDIVDTFQPDPMSSSFRKPKSDMNIASGCPRFVSHEDLENGEFIVNDTIHIEWMVDTTNPVHVALGC